MTDDAATQQTPEPTAVSAEIDQHCDRFEAAWKAGEPPRIEEYLKAGAQARDSTERELLVELVKIDLHYRWGMAASKSDGEQASEGTHDLSPGESLAKRPLLEHYAERFPQLGPVSDLPESLIACEYRARHRSGQPPSHEEYRNRFGQPAARLSELLSRIDDELSLVEGPKIGKHCKVAGSGGLHVRCPHCRNPIEIEDDTPMVEIECPSCGSSFNLAGDEALAHQTLGGTLRRRRAIGHFELIEQLGSGAFGAVWKARDTQLDRTVAVKIPRRGQLDREETEKFLREARAAAQLRHPNIVSVHEIGLEEDLIYSVSDFIEGVSLHDWLTGKKLTYREAAELCAKIAEAIHFAHEQGVIHRDLKPSNILLDRSGEPHIMDFGLAKRAAGEITMTTDGQILGTPAYMSPEQARGESHQADRRSDVYSVGVILFELLTGERPFRGNVRMLIRQVIEDEPPSPRKLNATVPRELETICLKCMENDPRRRYATARDLADELRRYLSGKPIEARPISAAGRLWRWCRRNPVVAALTATAALLLAAVAVVSTVGYATASAAWRSEADQREDAESARAVAVQHEEEARKAQREAERLAGELLLDKVRQLRRERPPGWTRQGLENLSKATRLRGARDDVVALRSDAASCLMGTDIRQIATLADDQATYCVAFSSDSRTLAIAGAKAWAHAICKVTLVDLQDRSTKPLTFRPSIRWQLANGVQDGSRSVALSPDGRWLAVGTRSGWIHRWDLTNDPPAAASWHAHDDWVRCLVFSHDKRAMFSSGGGSVKRWDIGAGWEQTAKHDQAGGRVHLSLSPDGSRLAVSESIPHSPNMVRWFDPKTLKPGGDTKADYAGPVSYCGRTGLVAATDRKRVHFIRETDQNVSHRLEDPKLGVAHQGDLHLSVGRNGALVVTGGSDGRLRLWEVATGRLLADLSLGVQYVRPVFSPDGRYVATPAGRRVILYEVGGTDVCRSVAVCDKPVRAIDVSRSGDRLATVVGAENEPGEVLMWDLPENRLDSRSPVLSIFAESRRVFLSMHPSDPLVAFNDEDELLQVCRLRKGLTVDGSRRISGKQFAFGPEPGVLWALPPHGGIARLDLSTFKVLSHWQADLARIMDGANGIGCMAVSDHWALAGIDNGELALLRVSDGKHMAPFDGPGGAISALAIRRDETLAACGTVKGLARIISISKRRTVCDLGPHTDQISALAFSKDTGLVATACRDSQVRLWRLGEDSAEELVRLRFPGGPVDDVRFLSDDSGLAVLVHRERGVRLVDLGRLRHGLRELGLDW